MSSVDQITENDVVAAVCDYLEARGFKIKQRLTTRQQGDDIIAGRGDTTLFIEAKGATSARAGSERFGRPFDSAQVRVHVAEAVYKAIQVLSRSNDRSNTRAAIALPANDVHDREVRTVMRMLQELKITVFWVRALNDVQEAAPD